MNISTAQELEELHPALWRASQLARSVGKCVDTGHIALNNALSGGGWPTGHFVDLLVQQPGSGEMRLLAPALSKVADRQVAMIEPPHPPHAIALAGLGLMPQNLLWIKTKVTNDALWATEQILRSGCYGAVLLWSNHMRAESMRRLNLAAQAGDSLFFILRPLAAAQDASPAPLRLSLRPAPQGIEIGFVKHRGPPRDPLFLPLSVAGAFTHRLAAPGTPRPAIYEETPVAVATP